MFLKQSIVLVAIALLLVEANASRVSKLTRRSSDHEKHDTAGSFKLNFHTSDSSSDEEEGSHAKSHGKGIGFGLGNIMGSLSSLKGGASGGGLKGGASGGGSGGGSGVGGGVGGAVCSCGQFKEVMSKVAFLLKAYGSKELIPDLQALGLKAVHYFLNYLAKEKPDELNKFHGFLTSTTKITGNFVGDAIKAGGL